MTWAEYVATVYEHLSVDADRRGLEKFRIRAVKNAVIDLQRYIRAYREGHTTIYTAANLQDYGFAQLGAFPPGARPTAFYIYEYVTLGQSSVVVTDGDFSPIDFSSIDFPTGGVSMVTSQLSGAATGDFSPDDFSSLDFAVGVIEVSPDDDRVRRRNRLDRVPWLERQQMLNGTMARRSYVYSISPQGKKFAIFPPVSKSTNTELWLVWDGLRMEFGDDDVVPFPEESTEAVAAYVKWRIIQEVDKDLRLAAASFQIYQMKRLALYRDAQEAQTADDADEEPVGAIINTPSEDISPSIDVQPQDQISL